MVSKKDSSLWGWKQLIIESFEHSCMDSKEKASAFGAWNAAWDKFLRWVVQQEGRLLQEKDHDSRNNVSGAELERTTSSDA